MARVGARARDADGHERADAPARARSLAGRRDEGYWSISMRPLHVLAFLTPLVLLYELGSILYLTGAGGSLIETIRAHKILSGFFESFGVAGLHLPAVALLLVLLVWHVLERGRWTIRLPALAGMLMESVAWMLPLLVMTAMVQRLAQGGLPVPAAAAAPVESLMGLPWQARLTISIGAGLYEELLFRMIIIAAVHFLAVDLVRTGEAAGRTAAVLVSAAAFALYHDLGAPGGGINAVAAVHYLLAGLYFAVLYLVRGFGIVVGVHAMFDVLVLILLRR